MQVKWTSKALQDLETILQYISQEDPDTATSVAQRLWDHAKALESFPRLGKPGRLKNTRELIITDLPYIVPYILENEQVIILRVLHQAMKWP